MRYSEKEQPEDSGILQKILSVVSAPTRFLNEVMVKVVFMPRKMIEEVLMLSIGIGFATTLIDFLLAKFIAGKGILDGKFPVLYRIIALATILVFYLFYELHEFNIYKQVNSLVELHNAPKTSAEDTGIAASLLDDSDDTESSEDMPGMTKISLDEEEEENVDPNAADTIDSDSFAKALSTGNMSLNLTLDKSLLSDDTSDTTSLDAAFPELDVTSAVKAADSGISADLLSDDSEDKPLEPQETESEFVNPESLPKPKVIKALEGNTDIVNYQDKLSICINDLLSAGLTYEGELSSEAVSEIDSLISNTPDDSEYALDSDVSKDLDSLVMDDAMNLADIQKTWKVPLDAVDLI